MTCSDVALYKAKEGGRQLVASFDLADLESLRNAKEIADDIHRGLENGEFVPFYQPQIATATGEVVALEVLVRWQHPHRGLLAPGAFLDIAADVHVDGEIDRAVFRRATEECRDRYADAENPPSLSFNVGHARLMDDQLLVELDRMAYSGTATFELVETVFLEEQSEAFLTRIAALRARGVSFEVDGFGSGRASIVGLRRLAPDRLKIDRRLIEPIVESRSGRKLVKSIVDIGLALDIGVTAAGVETTEQAVTLRALGCDRLQGFLFSPPVPLADLPPTATALPAANVAGGG